MQITNTVEVLDFSTQVLNDLAAAKSDDGKISVVEVVQASLKNAPAAVKAAMGADEIALELKDLSPDELKTIAEKSIEVAKAAMRFVGSSKAA